MFSRKRHFYEKKTFYAAVITAFSLVLSLSLWMSGEPVPLEDPMELYESTDEPPEWNKDTQVSSGHVNQNIGQPGITGNSALEKPKTSGYLVKEDAQYIKVYQLEEDGSQTVIRTSDIRFDLLGSEDQEMFRSGVWLENQDQLMELLQDFES